MQLPQEQERLIHFVLHHESSTSVMLNGEKVLVEIGQGNKRYLQYGITTYEKATRNSPGKAGEYVQDNLEVTICITTGRPWRLLVNGQEEKM